MAFLNKNLVFATRFISTSRINNCQTLVKKKTLQAKFQVDDGKPVWLKGGLYDRFLYTTTVTLCCIGLLMNFIVIFNQAKPSSWKNPVC
ncbi:PREDICTED: cytochrome c oxidase subunit 7A1, mitochondrial-like [Papilio xuthus]|uniref:Cytochrome c oxidase subunit 7A1, mitochondrial-like n=1 Tax=Papilio xuthus TaxID=66420 RepID=A0AAJ6ZER1_PAPXU|nr:PREDICTED: cytochrome c oxidase subunit 7A1, mitochondrial-like [Papilio xuthus]